MTGRGPDHRVPRALSLQRWSDLTFLHWALPASAVAEQLPAGLEVDTFDGRAWVGLTPLVMRDVRAPYVPAVPHLSDFVEVNLRTYVRGPDGTAGIWFFSLECARLPVVLALRALALPYQWARAEVATGPARIAYRTRRVGTGLGMRAAVRVGEPVEPDPLATFLTARWWAYTPWGQRLWRVPVEHEPWPLRRATARVAAGDLFRTAGLPAPWVEPLVHFSPGVHVRVGAPQPA